MLWYGRTATPYQPNDTNRVYVSTSTECIAYKPALCTVRLVETVFNEHAP